MNTQAPELTRTEQRLLDEFQHGFPLDAQPYARIAEQLGITRQAVQQRRASRGMPMLLDAAAQLASLE